MNDQYVPGSGKQLRSDNTIVNSADGINDDGSRNVKLMGSNVSKGRMETEGTPNTYYEKLLNSMTIAAGVEKAIMVPISGFSKIFVSALGDKNFDLYSYPSPDGEYLTGKETLASAVTGASGECVPISKLMPYARIAVKNVSASTGNFQLWIYGIRG